MLEVLDPLDERELVLLELKRAKDSERRLSAAGRINRVMIRAAREMSGEAFAWFEDEMYLELFKLVHSSYWAEKLGGVAAIEALISAPSNEPDGKGIRFANVLSNALKHTCSDNGNDTLNKRDAESRLFVTRTAAALGRLARRGPASSTDLAEFEVGRALEWLLQIQTNDTNRGTKAYKTSKSTAILSLYSFQQNSSSSRKRLAACLVLRELARHAPTLFFGRIRDFFDRIWPALSDPHDAAIRDAAAAALAAALEIVAQRRSAQHTHFYCAIYAKAHAVLAPLVSSSTALSGLPPGNRFEPPPERFAVSVPSSVISGSSGSLLSDHQPRRSETSPSSGNYSPERPRLAWWRRLLFASMPSENTSAHYSSRTSPPDGSNRRRSSEISSRTRTPMSEALFYPDDNALVTTSTEATRLSNARRSSAPPTLTLAAATTATPRQSTVDTVSAAKRLRPYSTALATNSTSRTTTEASAHGALLVVGALLKHAGPFMTPRFGEACEAAIALREHKSMAIRKAVTELLPRLAQYCPEVFSRRYLQMTTQHLIKCARATSTRLNPPELHDASYEALGRLALAVRFYLVPAIPELVQTICEHGLDFPLPSNATSTAALAQNYTAGIDHGSLASTFDSDLDATPELRSVGWRGLGSTLGPTLATPATGGAGLKVKGKHTPTATAQNVTVVDEKRRAIVLDCVADIVEALRDHMSPQHIDLLLDALFSGGLSEPLIRTLNVVANALPSRRPLVRARLLDALTAVISENGEPFRPPGWLRPVLRQKLDVEVLPPIHVSPERAPMILLSLEALANFSVEGVCLLPLIRDCVSRYLTCPSSSAIRAAAVGTCARLLLPPTAEVPEQSENFDCEVNFEKKVRQRASSTASASSNGTARRLSESARRQPLRPFIEEDENDAENDVRFDNDDEADDDDDDEADNDEIEDNDVSSSGSRPPSVSSEETMHPKVKQFNTKLKNDGVSVAGTDESSILLRRDSARNRKHSRSAAIQLEETRHQLPAWYYVGPSAGLVDQVLKKLLRVAVADDDVLPRRAVLAALRADDRFDAHLCRGQHVEAISLLLNDEDTELQLATLALLGRLAFTNPAAVLGRIRDVLSRALADLRCDASDAPAKERAARLAAAALRAESPRARRAVWPLAAAVIDALPLGYRELGGNLGKKQRTVQAAGNVNGSAMYHSSGSSDGLSTRSRVLMLKSQSYLRADRKLIGLPNPGDDLQLVAKQSMGGRGVPTRLACAALDALAECVLVLGMRARTIVYTPRVLSPLFDALLDRSSSRKRELALKVIGRLASCAGCVVAPYIEHAPLLPRMLAVLREHSGPSSSGGPSCGHGGMSSLCREALRALGLLGALDPYKFELVQRGARDCRKHAAKVAYKAAREAREEYSQTLITPITIPETNTSLLAPMTAATSARGVIAQMNNRNSDLTVEAAKRPEEPPLLAPYVAALLEDDEDEPAHAAMYAQSCAVALPATRDEISNQSASRKGTNTNKRTESGLLEVTGINAGEIAMDMAVRGDDVDAYYFLAHIVEEEDSASVNDRTGENGQWKGQTVQNLSTKRRRQTTGGGKRLGLFASASNDEDVYARVAIDALVMVLRDSSLAAHHAAVTQAITYIFQALGASSVPFLSDVVPHLLDAARNCEAGLRESILLQLAALASVVRHNLRDWLPRIFDLVVEYWQEHLEQVVSLLEEIATSVPEFIAPFIPRVLPLLLASLAPPYTTGASASPSNDDKKTKIQSTTKKGGRSVSGANNESSFVDEEPPLLHAATAAAAPAALSESRLALVLRVTMVLREALAEQLFLVVPALLRLAEALGDIIGTNESYLKYHRALEDGDAQRAAIAFERMADRDGWGELQWQGLVSSQSDTFLPVSQATAAYSGLTTQHSIGGASTPGLTAGVDNEEDVNKDASKSKQLQRDFNSPAIGPLWQARVVRCIRVVCCRGALVRRKDLGARTSRALCRLLELSEIATTVEQRPALEALRDACGDALISVASQLGSTLFAPFENAATRALSLGPHGSTSAAVQRWKRSLAECRGDNEATPCLRRDTYDDMLPDSAFFVGRDDDSDMGAVDEMTGHHRSRRASSIDARFEDAALDEMSAVARRAGQRDVPALRRIRSRRGFDSSSYQGRSTTGLIVDESVRRSASASQLGAGTDSRSTDANRQRLHVNQQNLQRSWDVSQRLTADDWNDWLRRFALELLRESPSAALRACATVAHAYPRLSRQLFQSSFVSCWTELDDAYRDSLVRTLETAFRSNELHAVAPDALQLLLELAEYMERDVDALPIDIRALAELATKCRAYAKALHYKELEYRTPELARDRYAVAEDLIQINRKLAQGEAALGVLHAARRHMHSQRRVTRHFNVSALNSQNVDIQRENVENGNDESVPLRSAPEQVPVQPFAVVSNVEDTWGVSEEWLRKLGSYAEALPLYERRMEEDPDNIEACLGAMKCLEALGEWERACSLLETAWPRLRTGDQDTSSRHGLQPNHTHTLASTQPRNRSLRETRNLMKAANVGARAAWALGRWDAMSTFVAAMEDEDGSKPFYRAVLALRPRDDTPLGDLNLAERLVDDTRRAHHNTFAALVAESYKRAFTNMVLVQQLSELEEIIELRKIEHESRVDGTDAPAAGLFASAISGLPNLSVATSAVNNRSLSSNDRRNTADMRSQLITRWRRRLAGCPQDAAVWQKVLNVRSLVLSFSDDPDTWLRYAALCRHAGQSSLSESVLTRQLGFDPTSSASSDQSLGEHRLRYAYSKHAWAAGRRDDALNLITGLVAALGAIDLQQTDIGQSMRHGVPKLRAKCLLRIGDWRLAQRSADEHRQRGSNATLRPMSPPSQIDACSTDEFVLTANYYELATRLDPSSYKAWHAWALVNYRAVQRSWAATSISMTPEREASQSTLRRTGCETPSSSKEERRGRHARLVAAASAFVRAIGLGRRRWAASVQQDLLNLLNLWFRSGRQSEVEALILADCDSDEQFYDDDNAHSMRNVVSAASRVDDQKEADEDSKKNKETSRNSTSGQELLASQSHRQFSSSTTNSSRRGIKSTPLDAWLGVLPQLIARIGAADASPKSALHRLLARLGARHPQALMYPLSLQLKSPREERRAAASAILTAPRQVAPRLVEQALLVSEELIRVAILWHEKWHEGLEEASRLYFGDHDVDGMMAILRPLHAELDKGPNTLREASFQTAYGRDLAHASECLDKYERAAKALKLLPPVPRLNGDHRRPPRRQSRSSRGAHEFNEEAGSEDAYERLKKQGDDAINEAWDKYYTVFRKINKQLPQFTNLELQYVSPALVNVRDLELAVPGTYRVDGDASRIARFGASVHVITSKQRPRKLAMRGSDGREYGFLLKGHEDLRQDERAMQLFGLANALLARDRRTREHGHLFIQRYAVTPLSHNCGVVGWVPWCDTLHSLVRDFREARKIVLNIEHRTMLQLAPDYDALTLAQKIEVFDAALADRPGQDLMKVLWLKSAHSEQWLERRTHYTRSLATMSMVGHILGLGDRHPSNLMLDRRTGKILHIDFGDCFEVAQLREKMPERVPFRLTRMLVNAMEVSGIEGTFRATCEKVMRFLRDNRDSLLSMLEAFIHDPLISWRLLGPAVEVDDQPGAATSFEAEAAAAAAATVSHRAPKISEYEVLQEGEDEDDSEEDDEDEVSEDDDDGANNSAQTHHGEEDDVGSNSEEDEDISEEDDSTDTEDSEEDGSEDGSYDENNSAGSRATESIPSSANVATSRRSRARSHSRPLHIKMSEMANSISLNSTRYSGHTLNDGNNGQKSASVHGSVAHSRLDHRSTRERQLVQTLGEDGAEAPIEALNEKALNVMSRVEDKLTGCDFEDSGLLSVEDQVDRLILQATDVSNLCQAFVGWCPFW